MKKRETKDRMTKQEGLKSLCLRVPALLLLSGNGSSTTSVKESWETKKRFWVSVTSYVDVREGFEQHLSPARETIGHDLTCRTPFLFYDHRWLSKSNVTFQSTSNLIPIPPSYQSDYPPSLPPNLCPIQKTHPVVLVCWPRTRRSQWCLKPRWERIFFRRSMSSRNLESNPLDRTWEFFPSVMSFCLFKNQAGILNSAGFCRMVTIRSSSSELSSPALGRERRGKGRISLKVLRIREGGS